MPEANMPAPGGGTPTGSAATSTSKPLPVSSALTKMFRQAHGVATISITMWIVIFAMGSTVSSAPFRARLDGTSGDASAPATSPMEVIAGIFEMVWAMIMVMATFTPPNIAVLCCFAAVAGSAGNQLMMTSMTKPGQTAHNVANTWVFHRAAAVRGFFVYLLLLSGLLLVTGDPFSAPTQGQYIRLAGTSSLFCFIVGWQPSVLASMIDRVLSVAQIEQEAAPKGAPQPAASTLTDVKPVIIMPNGTGPGAAVVTTPAKPPVAPGPPAN